MNTTTFDLLQTGDPFLFPLDWDTVYSKIGPLTYVDGAGNAYALCCEPQEKAVLVIAGGFFEGEF